MKISYEPMVMECLKQVNDGKYKSLNTIREAMDMDTTMFYDIISMEKKRVSLETVGRFCEVLHIDLYNAIKII